MNLKEIAKNKSFSFEIIYRDRKPKNFKEKTNFIDGKRDYAFIAKPNGLNELKGKHYRCVIDVHITEEEIDLNDLLA